MRYFPFGPLLLAVFLGALGQSGLAWSSDCDHLLSAETHFNAVSEIGSNLAYAQSLYQQFRERSNVILRNLQTEESAGHVEVFDAVGIGAGPHNGCLLAGLKETDPAAKTLVIEASDSSGTFQKLGKSFRLNTSELEHVSGNTFPGLPVQVADFNPEGKRYAEAEAVGDATLGAYDYSDTPILFEQKVTSIEMTESGAPARYRLTTESGLHVYANHISIATGMGSPSIRVTDEASLALIHSEMDKPFSQLEEVDDFLKDCDRASSSSPGSIPDLSEEEVALVGAGDGGNIGVEAAGGLAQGLPESVNMRLRAKKIIWIGQKSKTAPDFIKALGDRKAARYSDIASLYENGVLDPREGRLEKIEKIVVAGKTRYQLTYSSSNGERSQVSVDRVIFSTGYKNESPGLLSGLGDKTAVQPIQGSLHGKRVPIGDQVSLDGKAQNIWVVGNASSIQPSDEEWDQAVGGFMDILLPRSREVGKKIGTQILRSGVGSRIAPHILHSSLGASFSYEIPSVNASANGALAQEKILLAKLLRDWNSSLDRGGSLRIEFSRSASHNLKINIQGISESDSSDLVAKIKADSALLRGASALLDKADGGKMVLVLPAFSNGKFEFHRVRLF